MRDARCTIQCTKSECRCGETEAGMEEGRVRLGTREIGIAGRGQSETSHNSECIARHFLEYTSDGSSDTCVTGMPKNFE